MKATHKGTCQICERVQKLPKEKMSKHGYTIDFGYFQGVCHGASCLPFEESCEILREELIQVGLYITRQEKRIVELRSKAPKGNKAFMSLYDLVIGRSVIQEVTFYFEGKDLYFKSHYKSCSFPKKRYPGCRYGFSSSKTIQDAVRRANKLYADYISHELKSVLCWAKRAQERCDNWKLQPLIPIAGE